LVASSDADPIARRVLLELLADSLAATGQFAETTAIYRRVLALMPADMGPASSDRVRQAELMRKLAAALKPQLQFAEADALYDRALILLEQTDNASPAERRVWLHIQLERLDLYYLQAQVEEMASLTAEIEPVARQLADPHYLTLYYAAATRLRMHQERFRLSDETVRLGSERLANALATADPREIAEQRFGQGFILLWAGRLAKAGEPLRAALTKAEELDHVFLQVRCLAYLSILHRLQGDVAQVKRYLALSEQIVYQDKHRSYIGVEQTSRAWLAYLDQSWAQAKAQALAALASWDDIFYPFGWLAHWILLAHGLTKGDLQQARQAAAEMLDPRQQRLPDEITAALEEVRQVIDSGHLEATPVALERVLSLAQDEGYL
jgi:hypothetical protein